MLLMVHAERSDILPFAKDANCFFYFNEIDTDSKAGIISTTLSCLHEVEVEVVVSVTLDGPAQHFFTMKLLGVNFDVEHLVPYFPYPFSFKNVCQFRSMSYAKII